MKERVTTKEASEMLGIPEQAIRVKMKKGGLTEIGFCINEGRRASYYIFRSKLIKYLGKEE